MEEMERVHGKEMEKALQEQKQQMEYKYNQDIASIKLHNKKLQQTVNELSKSVRSGSKPVFDIHHNTSGSTTYQRILDSRKKRSHVSKQPKQADVLTSTQNAKTAIKTGVSDATMCIDCMQKENHITVIESENALLSEEIYYLTQENQV